MLLLFSYNSYGYIDPGTTSAIFGILAPLLSMLLIILGFLIQPFRKFFRFVIDKFRGSAKSKTNMNKFLFFSL